MRMIDARKHFALFRTNQMNTNTSLQTPSQKITLTAVLFAVFDCFQSVINIFRFCNIIISVKYS